MRLVASVTAITSCCHAHRETGAIKSCLAEWKMLFSAHGINLTALEVVGDSYRRHSLEEYIAGN